MTEGSILTLVDNFERGKIDYINHLLELPNVKLLTGDLLNEDFCNRAIEGADIVIHLASKVGGIGFYTGKPYLVMDSNITMDSNVLRATINNNVERYFYASTSHLYPIELQGTPDSPPITEDQAYPASPELSYGWAKLIGEKQIESAIKETKSFRASIARYIGIFGENQDIALETGSVIPVFSHRAIKYPVIPFSVWGTGQETRSYCYITDAIECTKLMIENMEERPLVGPYNVGKQERHSIEEIALTIIDISRKEIQIEFDTTKETLIWGQWCDCSAVKRDLGWEAKVSFRDGLQKVYEDVKRRIQ